GTTIIGTPVTVNVVNGAASASYALPAATQAGSYTIQAVCNGGPNFAPSSIDATRGLTVTRATTTSTPASVSVNFSTTDQPVPPSAAVTSPGGTVNGGTVTFTLLNGSTPLGPAMSGPVINGLASVTCDVPGGTPAGSYTVQAVYSGGTNFAPCTGATLALTVN